MKTGFRILPLAVFLAAVSPASAQTPLWSGIIEPSRAVDWSNAGTSGGIPHRTTICATLNPGATGAQINTAIASCPANQVVFLNAGTYSVSGGIIFNGKSNVTLRGAGPDRTIINFTSGNPCGGQGGNLCVINANPVFTGSFSVQPGRSNAASWTAGYAKGSTQITLSNVSGLAPGMVIHLDQANDTADNGGYIVCDIATTCHQPLESGSLGRVIGGVTYSQAQLVTITAISGNTVTITPPIYANNWRSSQTPGAWWPSNTVAGVGIEDLTVDHTLSGSTVQAGIYFYSCTGCWIRNIKSIKGNRNHVWLYQSTRAVVRDSYFFGTQSAASQSYGVEQFLSTDSLIENNIFDTVTTGIQTTSSQGNVVAYNFAINGFFSSAPSFMAAAAFAVHDAGPTLNLFEGNDFNAIYCDDIHGTSGIITFFRNRLTGLSPGNTVNTNAIVLQSFCRGFNVIGNVLGTAGYHSVYESHPGATVTNCDRSIFQLGFPNVVCGAPPPPLDQLVRNTLLRWGNFDVVTGAARFNASEVPTAGVPLINGNPVPATTTLPNSFYRTTKPYFFASLPWPAAGPDVTGGTGPGGRSHDIPAKVCYNNTPKTGGILDFNARNCYGPFPPTNLR